MDDEIEFIERLAPDLEKYENREFKLSRYNLYKKYMEQSEIPKIYRYEIIQNPFINSPAFKDADVKDFVNDVTDFISGEFNCIFNFSCYIDTDILASHIIQNYIKNYLVQDKPMKRIIYINVPLLLSDFKKMIGYNMDDMERDFSHNINTIRKGVENADLIIWDRMTMISTEYDRAELYRILSVRHKKGLSNLFFITGGKQDAIKNLSTNIVDFLYGKGMVNIN